MPHFRTDSGTALFSLPYSNLIIGLMVINYDMMSPYFPPTVYNFFFKLKLGVT